MNNILHVIYGYVYDVSVSNFEELSTINHGLKSSNSRPDIIPYVTEENFVFSHATKKWYTTIYILYEDPVRVKVKAILLQAWTRL
jgi:hypothetical protein